MQTITLEIEDNEYNDVLKALKNFSVRIKTAQESLPFMPNETTLQAMHEARLGQLESAKTIEQFLANIKS